MGGEKWGVGVGSWVDGFVTEQRGLCALAKAPRPAVAPLRSMPSRLLVWPLLQHLPAPFSHHCTCQQLATRSSASHPLTAPQLSPARPSPPEPSSRHAPMPLPQPRAMRTFTRRVLPILEGAAGHEVVLALTRCPSHACELLKHVDLSNIDAVAVAGCDEAFSETLQGLLSRDDWREAAGRVPLAHVPVRQSLLAALLAGLRRGGSGGGGGGGVRLARAAGVRDATVAAWAVCKGCVTARDVASVVQAPGRRRYVMLSVRGEGGVLVSGGAWGGGFLLPNWCCFCTPDAAGLGCCNTALPPANSQTALSLSPPHPPGPSHSPPG